MYFICLILNHGQHSGVTVFNCKQMLPPAEVLHSVIDQQTDANYYVSQLKL